MGNKKGVRLPRASKLEKLGLKREWIEPWALMIENIDRTGSKTWRLWTQRGEKLLCRVDWSKEKIGFICAFLDHLGRNGLRYIPRFIQTADGRRWVSAEDYSFYLCDYIESLPLNLFDRGQLEAAFHIMSQFHRCAESFVPPSESGPGLQRIPWTKQWEADLQTLRYYRGLVSDCQKMSAFDELFLEQANILTSQMDYALRLLQAADYDQLIDLKGQEIVCHGYFKEPCVRYTIRGDIYIDRFDFCHYNLRTYDLGRFLYRVLANCNWSLSVGQQCLNAYQELFPLTNQERRTLAAFLCFPHPAYAYIRAYYEQRSGCSPKDLVAGLRREAMNRGSKERFLNWAQHWFS